MRWQLGGGTGKGLSDSTTSSIPANRSAGARDDAGCAFRRPYAKPQGRPLVDTYITEVSQDTWIHFPWDTALSFSRRPSATGGVILSRHCGASEHRTTLGIRSDAYAPSPE